MVSSIKAHTVAFCRLEKNDMRASIDLQVHRATGHDGRQLAVKVVAVALIVVVVVIDTDGKCVSRSSTKRCSLCM